MTEFIQGQAKMRCLNHHWEGCTMKDNKLHDNCCFINLTNQAEFITENLTHLITV